MTQEDLPKIKFSQLPFIVKFLTYWVALKFIFWVLLVLAYIVLIGAGEKTWLVMLGAILK